MKRVLLAVLVSFLFVSLVHAADHGTAKEAVALVNKAVEYYKANGQDKAFAAFNDKKGQFVYKDLYIFAIDWKGTIIAHGANEKLINKPTADLRDSDGKLFMREMVKVAQTKGNGWVDYKWTNPVSKKIEPKSSYVQRVAGRDLLIGCGIYKGN
ncbi:MAG: cache domain-containing protein [Syntrophales bacterium]